ncbi:MAG: phosphoribosylformylglycinamidine synthase subunit PurQ [bacterium]|nr:phosphoribosylformylglycinamidine synthase subunit PurQ [bacterium]
MKRVGVVLFPGTNCEVETLRAYQIQDRFNAELIWHNEPLPKGFDLIILPGGWSYGDTLRAGAIARFSRVMEGVVEFSKQGGLVLGICNGFQILTEAGLLPGALARNSKLRFRCETVFCKVEHCNSPFVRSLQGKIYPLPIAHGEGRFVADDKTLERLEANGQIALRYCNNRGMATPESNPNGSLRNIAGIVNREGNVFGLMPHPERRNDPLVGGTEGADLLYNWVMHL